MAPDKCNATIDPHDEASMYMASSANEQQSRRTTPGSGFAGGGRAMFADWPAGEVLRKGLEMDD